MWSTRTCWPLSKHRSRRQPLAAAGNQGAAPWPLVETDAGTGTERASMAKGINCDRRRFLTAALVGIASTQFGMINSEGAQDGKTKSPIVPTIKPGTNK